MNPVRDIYCSFRKIMRMNMTSKEQKEMINTINTTGEQGFYRLRDQRFYGVNNYGHLRRPISNGVKKATLLILFFLLPSITFAENTDKNRIRWKSLTAT